MPADVDYFDTFIAVAEDCPVEVATEPTSARGAAKTAATIQFALLDEPYRWTSETLIFRATTAGRALADASADEQQAAEAEFFARPQACLRASPLPKRWGWGLHFDSDGRVARVGLGTADYERLASDPALQQLKAMRSSRR